MRSAAERKLSIGWSLFCSLDAHCESVNGSPAVRDFNPVPVSRRLPPERRLLGHARHLPYGRPVHRSRNRQFYSVQRLRTRPSGYDVQARRDSSHKEYRLYGAITRRCYQYG